jgi:3-hydroxyacyl-CoA dehydrogenase
VVDDLTGSKLGRAKSGTFRTADVVGLDTMGHVIKTMQDTLPDDPFAAIYKTPEVLTKLVAAGALGQKTGAGFYKKVGKEVQRLDFATGQYVTGGGKADDLVVRILKEKDPAKRMKALRDSTNPQAQFLWAIFRDAFHYIAVHLEAVADNARDIDFAMRWGFGQKLGPFETWQAAGWQQVAGWVKEDIESGKALCAAPLPAWVFDGRTGVHAADGSWSPARKANVPRSALAVYARQPFRAPVLGEGAADGSKAGTTVFEDDSVRIWHQGDEVLVFSIKTKMHAIGAGVIDGLGQGHRRGRSQLQGPGDLGRGCGRRRCLLRRCRPAGHAAAVHVGRRQGHRAGSRQAAGLLPAHEVRQRAGGRGRGRPGTGRRLRAGAARCQDASPRSSPTSAWSKSASA